MWNKNMNSLNEFNDFYRTLMETDTRKRRTQFNATKIRCDVFLQQKKNEPEILRDITGTVISGNVGKIDFDNQSLKSYSTNFDDFKFDKRTQSLKISSNGDVITISGAKITD